MSEAGTHTLTGRDVKVLAFIAGAFGVYVAVYLLNSASYILYAYGHGDFITPDGARWIESIVKVLAAFGVGWTLRSRSLTNWAIGGALITWHIPVALSLWRELLSWFEIMTPYSGRTPFQGIEWFAVQVLFWIAVVFGSFHLGALLRRRLGAATVARTLEG